MSPVEPKVVTARRLLVKCRDLVSQLKEDKQAITDARLVLNRLSALETEIYTIHTELVALIGEAADKQDDRDTPIEPTMARKLTPPPGTLSGMRARSDTSPGMAAFSDPPKAKDE